MTLSLMKLALTEGDAASSMLYLLSYSCMLRVPSEALPVVVGGNPLERLPAGVHSSIAVAGNEQVHKY